MESTARWIDEEETFVPLNNIEGSVTTSQSIVKVRKLTATTYMYITTRSSLLKAEIVLLNVGAECKTASYLQMLTSTRLGHWLHLT